MKARPILPALFAALLALVVAGCGSSSSGSGDGGTDPASVAPGKSLLYVEATIRPEGEAKANIEALAKDVGIDDLGGLIASEIEKSAAEEDEEIDFEKDVEPWLGEKGAIFSPNYKEGDFEDGAFVIQVTDSGAAEEFVDEHAKSGDGPAEDGSYEGIDFKVEEDGTTVGVFDDLLVSAETEALFKRMVDAANGESLADEDAFTEAVSHVPGGSAADFYVDIGGTIRASGSEFDQETQAFFDSAGIELRESTAVGSLIPGSDQIEIDFSTNLSGDNPPSGDGSELLGSLPGDSLAAFASAEFGKRFNEAIDQIDDKGIPGEVPPHQLKKSLKQSGIDLESIAGSIGDVGVFVEGTSERNLGGALVLTTDDSKQATNTVSNIGLLLRSTGVPGITAIKGEASGFSIRTPELGSQPLVVAAAGSRIAIAYGRSAATTALHEGGETLSDSPAYKEAVSALGGTPIAGFVDGPAALKLVSAVVAPDEAGFSEAKKYLTKIDYAALGSEASDGLATAKLIVGIGK
ncbi:MAG TPA: DUF3352 domain-containing protein [Solirubrobacterales bacterium]|nr:DUF3352 domain-containing protein [Solirubrobacterales bacterium]